MFMQTDPVQANEAAATPSSALIRDNFASDQLESILQWLETMVSSWGTPLSAAAVIAAIITIIGILCICVIADLVGKFVLKRLVYQSLKRRQSIWARELMDQQVLVRLSHFVPIMLLAAASPAFAPFGVDWWLHPILKVTAIWVLLMIAWGITEVFEQVLIAKGLDERMPIVSMSQAIKMVSLLIALLLSLSVLFTKSPLWFMSGLGAMAAVVMLIFKDAILGLVAGIQISANQMVRVGDWITIPSKGVDGDVESITLTTVNVRAFDQTLLLVPAYDLISTPFQNWRGMADSGGRRIKRSIPIDISSIRFVEQPDIDRYRKFSLLHDYLESRKEEIEQWNSSRQVNTSACVNGRQQTNVGIFRAYVNAYLRNHPKIHTEGFTFLVRQLPPGPGGLPIEIYVFTNDNAWVAYEEIQADIFDHLLAAVPEFDLEVHQDPMGSDIRSLRT